MLVFKFVFNSKHLKTFFLKFCPGTDKFAFNKDHGHSEENGVTKILLILCNVWLWKLLRWRLAFELFALTILILKLLENNKNPGATLAEPNMQMMAYIATNNTCKKNNKFMVMMSIKPYSNLVKFITSWL